MKEEFLHYIWRYRLFSTEYLVYSDQKIEVLETGEYNQSSGPDFFNSKIKIGDTIWVGNVEIHVKASDWYRHRHEHDKAYENVVLHMVYENDRQVFRGNGEEIPTGRLLFDPEIFKRYESLIRLEEDKICYHHFAKLDKVLYIDWIEKLEFQRLERKTQIAGEILKNNNHHWEATLYEMLAMSFGMKLNAEAFRLLTKMVPIEFVLKNRQNTKTLLAAFYGKAGFLAINNNFFKQDNSCLTAEYNAIKQLLPKNFLEVNIWKKMRSRPSGFPEIRIAQFINLARNTFPLFENLKRTENSARLREVIQSGIKTNFEEITGFLSDNKTLRNDPGSKTIDSIIINSTVPLLFYYANFMKKDELIRRSINILTELPPENNEILKKWSKFGIEANHAFDSQALIELKTQFCDKHRCTECIIGHKILSVEAGK
ncbi:MAG: DUF2851 family protein [Bacteroidales bacterium]|nr:DUF2851 family protein [Bacteroidales bacterium]MCF8389250.1 DUF2851 family protein [Bacteroidales bacterium]